MSQLISITGSDEMQKEWKNRQTIKFIVHDARRAGEMSG
jgi:hypothetical protein